MSPEFSSVEFLRELAARQGVFPSDADLEAVVRFLEAILPELDEIEALLPKETAP
jgi:hypothetical protein